MTHAPAIHATVRYLYETKEADISFVLLEAIRTDEDLDSFVEAPHEFSAFGEEFQMEEAATTTDETYQFMPEPSFDLTAELTKVTNGKYGSDLRKMWAGWKSEMTQPEVVAKYQRADADWYIKHFEHEFKCRPSVHSEYGMTELFKIIIAQPGSYDALKIAIAEGDASLTERMKMLRDLPDPISA